MDKSVALHFLNPLRLYFMLHTLQCPACRNAMTDLLAKTTADKLARNAAYGKPPQHDLSADEYVSEYPASEQAGHSFIACSSPDDENACGVGYPTGCHHFIQSRQDYCLRAEAHPIHSPDWPAYAQQWQSPEGVPLIIPKEG